MSRWLLVLAACTGTSTSPTDTDPSTDPATLAHREAATDCGERPLPAEPTCLGYAEDECGAHADCTSGDAGTCIRGGSYGLYCLCVYDGCREDADCGGGAVCGCASDAGYQVPTNTCLASDCRTDADCATGRCQAHHGFWCGNAGPDDELPITGWRCATASDTCNSDLDCDTAGGDRCIWDGIDRFGCSNDYAYACD